MPPLPGEGEEKVKMPPPASNRYPRPAVFATCLVDALLPAVGRATLAVLRARGLEPWLPPRQVCCGQALYKAGHLPAARRVARAWVEAFRGAELIVSPSGSCVAHVRHALPELLSPWPELARRARLLAARTWELSQFLHRLLGVEGLEGVPAPAERFTYHPSCGLHRALGEDEAPYRLLDSLPGRRLELPRAEQCCGFGGPFAVTHPEVSARLLGDKLAAARSTGAEVLVVGDVGCFLHLSCGAARRGETMRIVHLAQALARGEGRG